MVERQVRDLEVRGSNPDPGSNFSLEFMNLNFIYLFVYLYQNYLHMVEDQRFVQ